MDLEFAIIPARALLVTSFLSGVLGMLGGIGVLAAPSTWVPWLAARIRYTVPQVTADG